MGMLIIMTDNMKQNEISSLKEMLDPTTSVKLLLEMEILKMKSNHGEIKSYMK